MTKQKKRSAYRLFERGAAAYQLITGDTQELYPCPLCERRFPREAVSSEQLSCEDVPPRSLGGRVLALTCKDCNSTAGHAVDAQTFQREELARFERALLNHGVYSGRATFKVGRTSAAVSIETQGRMVTIQPVRGRNNPANIQLLQQHFAEVLRSGNWERERYQLTPRIRFHPRLSKVGDLRSAYLAAFARFGYRYALSEQLRPVRDQLREPLHETLTAYWLLPVEGFPAEKEIMLLSKPIAALAIHLGWATVILPWLEGSANPYDEILSHGFSD